MTNRVEIKKHVTQQSKERKLLENYLKMCCTLNVINVSFNIIYSNRASKRQKIHTVGETDTFHKNRMKLHRSEMILFTKNRRINYIGFLNIAILLFSNPLPTYLYFQFLVFIKQIKYILVIKAGNILTFLKCSQGENKVE